MKSTTKAWKVTCSGTYKTGPTEYESYMDLVGYIPLVNEDQIKYYVSNRYVVQWINHEKDKYPKPARSVREIFIEGYEQVDHEFSYVGKDIKKLTYEEVQDVATAKGLEPVPLFKKGGLRTQCEKLYMEYHKSVLKDELLDDFDYSKAAPIIVDGAIREFRRARLDAGKAFTLGNVDVDDGMSLEELKGIAKGMGINVRSNASKKTVMSMITGKAA